MDTDANVDDETTPPLDTGIPVRVLELFDPSSAPHGSALEMVPQPGEQLLELVRRTGDSDIPEEAVTIVAFALGAVDAISWACDCCETISDVFRDDDDAILTDLQVWLDEPTEAGRQSLLKLCLWEQERRPAVLLGLAAGFNGQLLAPHWPAEIPRALVSDCVNEALLEALSNVTPATRVDRISQFLVFAEPYL